MKRNTVKTIFRVIGLAASITVALPAIAEEIPGTDFSVHLESAQITGTGRSINLHRAPVVEISTGATKYYDISMDFSLDENGGFVFDTLSSLEVSQPLNVANFIAGTYKGTRGNTYTLSGPAHVGGTRTAWALVCNECRATMSWTTGSPIDHPDIGSRAISAELPGGFSYGVVGQRSSISDEFNNNLYRIGRLIGARQVGKSLTVYLFNDGGTDVSTTTASVTLLLEQQEGLPPPPPPQ